MKNNSTGSVVPMAEVSSAVSLKILIKQALKTAAALAVKPVRRHSEVVNADYNSGAWLDSLKRRPWADSASLDDYLFHSSNSALRIAKINNKIVRLRTWDYYKFRKDKVASTVIQNAIPGLDIVEV